MKKLVAKVGSYQKDGQSKNRYQDIGVIMSNDNGEYGLVNPVSLSGILIQQNVEAVKNGKQPSDRIMVSIFDNDSQGGGYQQGGQRQPAQGQQGQSQPAPENDFDDDIPF